MYFNTVKRFRFFKFDSLIFKIFFLYLCLGYTHEAYHKFNTLSDLREIGGKFGLWFI